MSFLNNIEVAPANAIFKLTALYKADTDGRAMDLGVGAYRTEKGDPWVLPVVIKAEQEIQKMMEKGEINHEYLPIGGLGTFVSAAGRLALGGGHEALDSQRIDGVQCISGTGSLRAIGDFIKKFGSNNHIYVSDPTWANHEKIFSACHLEVHKYRYYKPETRGLNLPAMLEDIEKMEEGSAIVLHACAHNPTGVDPNKEEWVKIAEVCQKRGLFVVFDSAYQGFASGDPIKDGYAMSKFAEMKIPMAICQSFSKNFGLYNERVGCAQIVSPTKEATAAAVSQLKVIVRANWSNPPHHGARIVSLVLNDETLTREWMDCLKTMSSRIHEMRSLVYEGLKKKGTPGTWEHIINQIGMFSFTGLTEIQVKHMTDEHHIYMLKNGRINMCGVTKLKVDHLVNAIHDTVTKHPSSL